ncbi:FHA domain-containing protein [Candidatus Venteria ishoeyi]|uniref:FHA domain-containing protein n=1 Tax=Candidatus Venteria ishoeyi TaxID=1899563 RepID=UPI0025A4DB59|nr:FHA domain-containing protein [Candidatus Venteria ishoeyi]MDM8544885.1 FHA domain-containing protein [Candidatus Venteria ishoeyi]
MSEFVRICPKCQQQNPEYEHVCQSCGQFIAMEMAIQKPEGDKATTTPPVAEETHTTPPPISEQKTRNTAATQRFDKNEVAAIYLQLNNSEQVFTVKHGWVMGQAHVQNKAQIQIPDDISGSEYLHRRHCRFIYQDGKWYVQALDQKRFQREFTNPTQVNQKTLTPGKAAQIQDGDTLMLSGLGFDVHFIRV